MRSSSTAQGRSTDRRCFSRGSRALDRTQHPQSELPTMFRMAERYHHLPHTLGQGADALWLRRRFRGCSVLPRRAMLEAAMALGDSCSFERSASRYSQSDLKDCNGPGTEVL